MRSGKSGQKLQKGTGFREILYLSPIFRQGRGVRLTSLLVAVAVAASPASSAAAAPATRARLVLQITVDQLRGDLPLRGRELWGKDGFRRLYEQGAVFSDAHHRHAITETVVGHVTLATGADPAVHGMVGNGWLDRRSGAMQFNVEDATHSVVGNDVPHRGPAVHAEAKSGKRHGRSPNSILAPTIADTIALAGGGRAKVFAVSLKDRAAVPMAGRAGKAFWWSNATGEFLSSTYYYPDRRLPAWAEDWNSEHKADDFDGESWRLLLDKKHYRYAAADDMPWEMPPAGLGRAFPHRFDRRRLGDNYYSALEASPFGDRLLVDFARELLRREDLGRDDVVDYLSVGFSSNDFIGHHYGPESLEMEDEVLRMDRVIAALLDAVDDEVGEGRTLVVLSADHGVVAPPGQLRAEGRDAGTVMLSAVEASEPVQKLKKRFGEFIRRNWPPYVYLDEEVLRRRGVAPETAARALAEEFARTPGIAAAFTRGQIESGKLPATQAARAVQFSFCPERSGDIHVVPKPGWQLAFEGDTTVRFATSHGTPWDYDTYVPLVFEGPGVARTTVPHRVETVDLAPTIAALLGLPPPLRTTGHVLREALR